MRKLSQGNEAIFRGALAAGASYYAGYPISTSTEILNVASGLAGSEGAEGIGVGEAEGEGGWLLHAVRMQMPVASRAAKRGGGIRPMVDELTPNRRRRGSSHECGVSSCAHGHQRTSCPCLRNGHL